MNIMYNLIYYAIKYSIIAVLLTFFVYWSIILIGTIIIEMISLFVWITI